MSKNRSPEVKPLNGAELAQAVMSRQITAEQVVVSLSAIAESGTEEPDRDLPNIGHGIDLVGVRLSRPQLESLHLSVNKLRSAGEVNPDLIEGIQTLVDIATDVNNLEVGEIKLRPKAIK